MEGEIRNGMVVWITVLASLCYCHTIAKFIPKAPPLCLWQRPSQLIQPTNHIAPLHPFSLPTHQGTPHPTPATPPNHKKPQETKFQQYPSHQNSHKPPLNCVIKIPVFALLVNVYKYKELIHPKVILVCYCLHVYFMLELLLVVVAALVRAMARLELELERPFNEPYPSTSLQKFWGKRWNLIVSSILCPIVYHPFGRFVAV
ncbi:acyl-CoA sterol acyl transferase 1 [Actinidia rufa]|uniref:Acyl-CoA sterol acyl transferase 1 n=1 Tax=Actinidia rufa TaxID=165716 RepID=A0A7J0EVZ1_9ERIC|nr:acyl-CoA sterol acyl transferase 1 [Actinidia rufa]